MDMSQYRELFLAEAGEHLSNLNDLVSAVAESPADAGKINALFRAAHSLKGMAASMGYDPIAELAHRMEDLLSMVRAGEMPFGKEIAALLLEAADLLAVLLDDIAMDRPLAADIESVVERLSKFTPLTHPSETKKPVLPTAPPGTASSPPGTVKDQLQTVRVRTEILDRLIDTTGELFTSKHRLLNITREAETPELKDAFNDLGRLLRELHQMVMQVRLMPFSSLAERFPRAVRELARKQGKQVSFHVTGREIELDRGVLEELADPLLHILRNAVDHGIEFPDQRKAAGKDPVGKVSLSLRREKDQAVIAVEDDGKGMDPARLIEAAVIKGLISAEQGAVLTPGDAFMLTCLAGFSTAPEITDVSGRGVGMDAVRSTVQSLGGNLSIDSEAGKGSRMLLRLPLSIAIVNVLLVSAGSCRLALPVSTVLRTLEIKQEQILMRDRHEYILLDETEIPLISLNRILGVPVAEPHSGFIPVLIALFRGQTAGLLVDKVLGQREIHVKPVGRPLNRLQGLAGGGILGTGEIVFVLDPATLL